MCFSRIAMLLLIYAAVTLQQPVVRALPHSSVLGIIAYLVTIIAPYTIVSYDIFVGSVDHTARKISPIYAH